MTIDELYNDAYTKIWQTDAETQNNYLSIITEARGVSINTLKGSKCIFIPNDEYLLYYCGEDAKRREFGLYRDNFCVWNNCLLLPITNLNNEVVGFAGFNPLKYAEVKEGNSNDNYYQYSSKDCFNKGRYLYCAEGIYSKAIREGYLIVVDGIFDALSLTDAGFNAAALMGSTPTQEILMQLRFVKRIIFIADNDQAGYKVYSLLRKYLRNVELVEQPYTKDADEILKSEKRNQFIKHLQSVIKNGSIGNINVFN